jgi:hypothetical protein
MIHRFNFEILKEKLENRFKAKIKYWAISPDKENFEVRFEKSATFENFRAFLKDEETNQELITGKIGLDDAMFLYDI